MSVSTNVGQEVAPLGAAARFGLLIGPLLSMIDSSIVNVAVPDIAKELKATLDDVQWVVSGYLLALGVALALTAYLAKRFGTLRIYTVSMVLFVVASALCAVAPTIGVLIAARAVQGFVGAPLVPLALSILLGKGGMGGGKVPVSAALVLFLAPALGPTLGGLLVGAGGWRWIFLVNVPVGVVGLLLQIWMPRHLGASADRETRFDPIGFVLLAVGLTAALLRRHGGRLGRVGEPGLVRAARWRARAPRGLRALGAAPRAPGAWTSRCSATGSRPWPSCCRCCARWSRSAPCSSSRCSPSPCRGTAPWTPASRCCRRAS